MNPRKRMIVVLATLVASMTAAAAVLAWADPTEEAAARQLAPREILVVVQTVVGSADSGSLPANHPVAIVAAEDRVTEGRLLRATGRQRTCHFWIDADGRPFRGSLWDQFNAAEGCPDGVRLEVVPPGKGQPMTTTQWLTVRALVDVLSERVGGEVRLPVSLGPDWSTVYGVEEGRLFELAPAALPLDAPSQD
jgi:hypothetical protein